MEEKPWRTGKGGSMTRPTWWPEDPVICPAYDTWCEGVEAGMKALVEHIETYLEENWALHYSDWRQLRGEVGLPPLLAGLRKERG